MKESAIQIYRLSEVGRSMTWKEYQSFGYGLTQWQDYGLSRAFGPIAHWSPNLTLGEIEDACPSAGRTMAMLFAERLELPDLAVTDGPPRFYK